MRDAYLGIDLGTSSVKAVLLDSAARELGSAQVRYAVERPEPGWAEQDPAVWWRATAEAIRAATGAGRFNVRAIGLAGQMHGLVAVGHDGLPLRRAIIWSDRRSGEQVATWSERLSPGRVEEVTGFPIATGMLGVSLTWMKDVQPELYAQTKAVLLPKDYIRFMLTGRIGTEPTDAGGSLLFDIRAGRASERIMDEVGLHAELFPPVIPTLSVAGEMTQEASEATGLPRGTAVVSGGGDQAMAAIALGLEDASRAAVAISSGGTVFKRTARPLDSSLGLHVLPAADAHSWLAMGVVLSAGLGVDWLAGRLFGGDTSRERVSSLMRQAESIAPGADGLLFSSQLGGTRTPVVDETVRGSLLGLSFHHGQAHVTRALVEGVCLALGASIERMSGAEEPVRELVISGGGARFAVWRQTLSDVTGLPVRVSSDIEHSALGAALAAAEAVGLPLDVDLRGRVSATIDPDPAAVELYRGLAHDLSSIEDALAKRKEPAMTLAPLFTSGWRAAQ